MKKISLFLLTLMLCSGIIHAVTFNVTVPKGTKACYIAGDFQGWDAGNAIAMTASGENTFTLTLNDVTNEAVQAGYKYLCGQDWAYVEKGANGEELSNRTSVSDMDVVLSWAATHNANIIVEELMVNGYKRTIKTYLPTNYSTSGRAYPVVYYTGVQQRYHKAGEGFGDDLFNADSWNVPAFYDALPDAQQCILVQMYGFVAENIPYEYEDFVGSGASDKFLDGFVGTLMPYINSKYRTLTGAANTTIMGADLGGLLSVYAALKYPNMFGQCVSMSPTIWLNRDEILEYAASASAGANAQRYYFSVGSLETSVIKNDVASIKDAVAARTNTSVKFITFEGGIHDDLSWGKSFVSIYPYLLADEGSNASENIRLASRSISVLPMAAGFESNSYSIVSAIDSQDLKLNSSAPFSYVAEFDSKSGSVYPVHVSIAEIPASVKTKYYWNVSNTADGEGELLMSANKDVSFSSKKSTTTWHRVLVKEDESISEVAANSEAFRVVTSAGSTIMSIVGNYKVKATVDFSAGKSFTVNFGSVNSGSDQGAVTKTHSVSTYCTAANVIYDFQTNGVTIEETAWSEERVDIKSNSYSIVSAVDSQSLVYDPNSTFTYINNFRVSGADVPAQVTVTEIPASIKTKYYWNVSRSADGTGELLMSENKDVSFSSKKSTMTWHRVAVMEDESVVAIAANSAAFRVVSSAGSTTMSVDGKFKVKASVDFTAGKSFTINFGSVNSGSDQGAVTETYNVSDNCIAADIVYDFLTNRVKITETEWSEVKIDIATTAYSLVSAIDSSNLTYDASSKFTYITNFISSEQEVPAQVTVTEIPADVKTQYYWNVSRSADGTGTLLKSENGNVGFSSKKTATSWHRVAILEDETVKDVAANSTAFRLVTASETIVMSITGDYKVKASAKFTGADKSFKVHYGSVNSGSDMGAITGSYSVSETCIAADIVYDFFTNSVTITETAWGETIDGVVIEQFSAVPSFLNAGTASKVSVTLANGSNCEVAMRMGHNYGSMSDVALTKEGSNTWSFTINDTQAGIYHVALDIKRGETVLDGAQTICIKVLDGKDVDKIVTVNAYADVDWNTIGRYKANFHTHTTQSFDANTRVDETVDLYHQAGYKILALTDHDANPYPWEMFDLFNTEAQSRNPWTLDMIAIPGNELSKDKRNTWDEKSGGSFNHHNDLFTGRKGMEFASLQESYAYTNAIGGMQIINHPGQYWSLSTKYTAGEKNSPEWHANNFKNYNSLIGLEVYNQGNRRPNDRILWDQILDITMPERPVWGYSCDDTHNLEQFFRNYEFMLMPEFTVDALKDAMRAGSLYFSYEYDGSGEAKAPRIESITVDNDAHTITIDTDASDIYWISSTDIQNVNSPSSRKSTVVGYGKTFDFTGFQGKYVRALITNKYGETCTQPFGFADAASSVIEDVEEAAPTVSVYPNPASDVVNVKSGSEILSVDLYNTMGQRVRNVQCDAENAVAIDVDDLAKGHYVISVKTIAKTHNQTLIVK